MKTEYQSYHILSTYGICTVCVLILLWCSEVDGLTISAASSYSRTLGSSSTTIGSGDYLYFNQYGVHNPTFFSLVNGRIRIHRSGRYLVMASAPFIGEAQMRFYLDNAAQHSTTVGQSSTGVLSAVSIINVPQNYMYLSWKNPSDHANVMPGTSISPKPRAHIIIIAVENVLGSSGFPGYLYANRFSDIFHGTPKYNIAYNKNINFVEPNSPTILIPSGKKYFVGYQFTPLISMTYKITADASYEGPLNAGRYGSGTHLVGRGITTYRFSMDYPEITVPEYIAAGGNQVVYDNLVVLDITDLPSFGNFYTMNGPNGPYTLSNGDKVPLINCGSCKNMNLNPDSTFKLPSYGKYLISVVFNTNNTGSIVITADDYEEETTAILKSGATSMLHGVTLISGSPQVTYSVKMKTSGYIGQKEGGGPYNTPVSVTVIQLS